MDLFEQFTVQEDKKDNISFWTSKFSLIFDKNDDALIYHASK